MPTLIDIEKDPRGARAIEALLGEGYRVLHCCEGEAALAAAREGRASACILDLDLEQEDAFGLLAAFARLRGAPPVIAVADDPEPRLVVQAIRGGAVDFFSKPLHLHELRLSLARVIGDLEAEPLSLLGTSPAIRELSAQLRVFATHDFPLLVTGESGTGKDLVARSLHSLSSRSPGPFIARNCAALPGELIESELFGCHRGAYTGASDRPGAFELARGGTILLDEIGEASPEAQAKMLRALESGEIWRLGARSPVGIDCRFVSATSRDLERAVDEGRFRLDLYYRIETLRLHLPPLRERPEDIAPLARHFLIQAAGGRKWLSEEALRVLLAGRWPGNARQLRNVIQRAVVLSGGRDEIVEKDILVY